MIINNKIQLMTFLRNLNISQRQDSVTDQAEDMVPVFESFGLLAQAQSLCHDFGVVDESTRYTGLIEDVVVKCDLESQNKKETKQIAINVANLFGCYDLADALKL